MRSVFVTGTDTDVGKTVIASCIARIASNAGLNVGVMKPFAASDTPSEKYNSYDTEILARAARCTEQDSILNPVFSNMPASPFTASQRTNLDVDVKKVLDGYSKLADAHDVMIVEGIGGIMTPILENYFVADLAREMNLPALIVVRNKIGALNHSLLAHMACTRSKVPVAGFIINCIDNDGYDPQVISQDILTLTKCPIVGIVSQVDLSDENDAFDAISGMINLECLHSHS